jgi:hypothetical protein
MEEQIDLFFKTDLINNAEFFFYCNYNESNFNWLKSYLADYPHCHFINVHANSSDYEFPTIIELQKNCNQDQEEFAVLYLHLKGVTHLNNPYNKPTEDWRHLMQYFNVENWRQCVAKLKDDYDTVGVNFCSDPLPHYSGNFWWARSSYIRILPALVCPSTIDYQCQLKFNNLKAYTFSYKVEVEMWVASKSPRWFSWHNSNKNHYNERYPESLYKKSKPTGISWRNHSYLTLCSNFIKEIISPRYHPG